MSSELGMLDSGKGCWINLVGLRKRVLDLPCWTEEKGVGLSLLDLGEECWIKFVGLRRRVYKSPC